MSIEEQITAVLEGRKTQQPSVNDLASIWESLTQSIATMTSSATALSREASITRPPDGEHATLFGNLVSYLGDRSDWQRRAANLAVRLAESKERVNVLHGRVNRQTVNIGVVGVTGAGKSTLLRQLTGLGEQHIPSNKYESSTATPSKIFHKAGAGQGEALLYLHTWTTFRDEFLVPLHEKAKISEPVPPTIEDFMRFKYPDGPVKAGEARTEQFARRLRLAQESLPSYRGLLTGGERAMTLDKLRRYVAYPQEYADLDRPYHAVRSVDITCEFPRVGAVRLGLVDLPGSGEAGLDVHGRFLRDLRNETDLLFMVKRPTKQRGNEQDWDVAQLADDASAGVRRSDFAHLVINRDAELGTEFFEWDSERASQDAAQLGISVRVCDIVRSSADEVARVILAPTLDHLASRLQAMDHDAIAAVLGELAEIAAEARGLASDLVRHISGWQGQLPDEEHRYRTLVHQLVTDNGRELEKVTKAYDSQFKSGDAAPELVAEIARAEGAVKLWRDTGLGHSSTAHWLDSYHAATVVGREGQELDLRYNATRNKFVQEFGEIDTSLHAAIERLWGEVAVALRVKLTAALVPEKDDGAAELAAFGELAATAQDGRPSAIDNAVIDLLNLQKDYGSLFLRVGRPVVRRVWWRDAAGRATVLDGGAAAPATGDDDGATAPGLGMGWLVGDTEPERYATPPAPSTTTPGEPASDPLAGEYPEAWQVYTDLCRFIDEVAEQLRKDFLAEAHKMMVVLAAAVEKFKDSLVRDPGIDIQWERLCAPTQRDIWPGMFADAAATVTAAMATLRQQAATVVTAADEATSLTSHARAL